MLNRRANTRANAFALWFSLSFVGCGRLLSPGIDQNSQGVWRRGEYLSSDWEWYKLLYMATKTSWCLKTLPYMPTVTCTYVILHATSPFQVA